MLVELAIRDIVLIDRLTLSFQKGLTVLTGETGAGKSILLDAFSLALGGRGDGSLVRHGETQGQVTAVFDCPPDHPAQTLARQADLDIEGDLILRRVQMADGRTRAFVNDQPVGVQVLKNIGAALVEIHGQHDDRALMDPHSHRQILDMFGGLQNQVLRVLECAREVKTARQQLEEQQLLIEKARRDIDFLRHAADELAQLAPEQGEEESLSERRTIMMQSEKVAQELNDAYDVIAGHASSVPDISSVLRKLQRRAAQVPALVDPSIEALNTILIACDEARPVLEEAIHSSKFNPRELEQVEERLFALRAAARKYSVQPDGLAGLYEKFASDLASIDQGESSLRALEQALQQADQNYQKAAHLLSEQRHATAKTLDEAVNAELPPLKLERAKFTTHIVTDQQSREAGGYDRVEFWAQTNPGTKPGPMMKVASGGELSRFMLALKVVLADKGSAPTLVFDEIDTGVGGAVADAIGQRLARLSHNVQVMAVTHAPQVAARANSHFLISKDKVMSGDDERVATQVRPLEHDPRREEIARMLSGAVISEEARAAAKRLLEHSFN